MCSNYTHIHTPTQANSLGSCVCRASFSLSIYLSIPHSFSLFLSISLYLSIYPSFSLSFSSSYYERCRRLEFTFQIIVKTKSYPKPLQMTSKGGLEQNKLISNHVFQLMGNEQSDYIRDPAAIWILLELLPYLNHALQVEVWQKLISIVGRSLRNLQVCCTIDLVPLCLDLISQCKEEKDAVLGERIAEFIGTISSYDLSVEELKLFLDALTPTEDNKWLLTLLLSQPTQSKQLLSAMRMMPKRIIPEIMFNFTGELGSAITIPPITRWPSNPGFTLNLWVSFDPRFMFPNYKPFLYWFKTGKGLGYSAMVSNQQLLLETVTGKGQITGKMTKTPSKIEKRLEPHTVSSITNYRCFICKFYGNHGNPPGNHGNRLVTMNPSFTGSVSGLGLVFPLGRRLFRQCYSSLHLPGLQWKGDVVDSVFFNTEHNNASIFYSTEFETVTTHAHIEQAQYLAKLRLDIGLQPPLLIRLRGLEQNKLISNHVFQLMGNEQSDYIRDPAAIWILLELLPYLNHALQWWTFVQRYLSDRLLLHKTRYGHKAVKLLLTLLALPMEVSNDFKHYYKLEMNVVEVVDVRSAVSKRPTTPS
eukprot:sb/3463296/